MRRTLFWLVLLTGLVLYSLVVYTWWIEGNTNFEIQRREALSESIISRH